MFKFNNFLLCSPKHLDHQLDYPEKNGPQWKRKKNVKDFFSNSELKKQLKSYIQSGVDLQYH